MGGPRAKSADAGPVGAAPRASFRQAPAVACGDARGLAGIIFAPLGGWVSDHTGRKPVMLGSWTLVLLGVMPMVAWLTDVTHSALAPAWRLTGAAPG